MCVLSEAGVFTLATSLQELSKFLVQGGGLGVGEAVARSDSRPDCWNCLVSASVPAFPILPVLP